MILLGHSLTHQRHDCCDSFIPETFLVSLPDIYKTNMCIGVVCVPIVLREFGPFSQSTKVSGQMIQEQVCEWWCILVRFRIERVWIWRLLAETWNWKSRILPIPASLIHISMYPISSMVIPWHHQNSGCATQYPSEPSHLPKSLVSWLNPGTAFRNIHKSLYLTYILRYETWSRPAKSLHSWNS